MAQTNQQRVIYLLIKLLMQGCTTAEISKQLNEQNLKSSRNLAFTELIVSAELNKIRNPNSRFTSSLYKALLLLLVAGEVTLKEIAQAFFTDRSKVTTL